MEQLKPRGVLHHAVIFLTVNTDGIELDNLLSG